MWLRMKHMLLQCVNLEPGKLRAVFDMLLNAAQPQLPSILEYSYAQITSFLVFNAIFYNLLWGDVGVSEHGGYSS